MPAYAGQEITDGDIVLSPELAEYRLFRPEDLKCWPAGTGYALADWLTARGIAPKWIELPPNPEAPASGR